MKLRLFAAMTIVILPILLLCTVAMAANTISPGQALTITVPGHPEFSQKVLVGSDGTIEYPLLTGIPVDGLTPLEVRDLLLPILMRYDREPEVFVTISQIQIIKVQIYGAVRSPGKYDAESPLNLQQLIAMAGQVTLEADVTAVRIYHYNRGVKVERVIDLTGHFSSDSVAITPELNDGDMVIVPLLTPLTSVRVYGEVNTPGEIYVTESDNLFDIIQRSGGYTTRADLKRVKIFAHDGRISASKKFDVADHIKNGKIAELPMVEAGDIIVVPAQESWRTAAWWVNWVRDLAVVTSSLVILINVL